jgi:hypothetical protein
MGACQFLAAVALAAFVVAQVSASTDHVATNSKDPASFSLPISTTSMSQAVARCTLKVVGDSSGRPLVNFTCVGPTVTAAITSKFIKPPALLQGVVTNQPSCAASPRCIVKLCSNTVPIVLQQGSELRAIRSEASPLCITGRHGTAAVNITNVVVADNVFESSRHSCGAMTVFGNSSVSIQNSRFYNNRNASALYIQDNPSVAISGCVFSRNQLVLKSYEGVCSRGGAAITACAEGRRPDQPINITDSLFAVNTVSGVVSGGGAIYTAWDMNLRSVNFTQNEAYGSGGGALWVDTKANLTAGNTNFKKNYVLGDGSEGGAIYARRGSSVSLNSCELHRNGAVGSRSRGEQ